MDLPHLLMFLIDVSKRTLEDCTKRTVSCLKFSRSHRNWGRWRTKCARLDARTH